MKKWFIAAAAVLLSLTLSACGSRAVATTSGGSVTESAYYDSLKNTSSGKQILQQMILNKVLEKQYGDKVSKSEVTKQFNTYKDQYGSSFNSVLQQSGTTQSGLKDRIRGDLLLKAAIADNITISDKDYQKQFKKFEPKVSVAQILVDKKSTAETVISKAKDGKNFSDLAKEYSTDKATKNKGGKIDAFDNTNTTLDAKFKNASFKLKTGEITKEPVKTQFGYHVIKMIKNPGKGKWQDNKAALKEQIVAAKSSDSDTLHDVIAKVLKKGNVQIKDNDLKNILSDYLSTSKSSSSSK